MRIGIDLGGTNVRVALVDTHGITKSIKEPCKADRPEGEIIDHLKTMIHKIISKDATGIGIGVPSAVDTARGIVYNVMNIPSWKEVHIKDILEEEFKLPTYVNNDANCFTLGEKYYGKGKLYKDMLGITLGTGVGAGVIINNELYNGSNTCAGEIGCLPYRDSTYEHYCSSHYFEAHHNTSGANVYNLAMEGDKSALEIWNNFGKHIGNLISMALYTYDPEAIVLGGSITNAYNLFAPSMQAQLKEFLFPQIIEKIKIEKSTTPDVGILGAAALVKNIN